MALQNPEQRPPEVDVRFGKGRVPESQFALLSRKEEGQFVGRAALPAFSAAGCVFEGQDPAQLGSLPATPESVISVLGSGRRCFTIGKVSHSSETGEQNDGCVDLATREAPASGPSSLCQ